MHAHGLSLALVLPPSLRFEKKRSCSCTLGILLMFMALLSPARTSRTEGGVAVERAKRATGRKAVGVVRVKEEWWEREKFEEITLGKTRRDIFIFVLLRWFFSSNFPPFFPHTHFLSSKF